jgi:DNA repair photolyase
MSTSIHGTKEWAEKNFNCSKGCYNNCKYCYAKSMAIRFGRIAESWSDEEVYLEQLEKVANRRKQTKYMFPSTHDITPATLETCLLAIRMVLDGKAKHELLIVSKPRLDCIKRLCNELQDYRARILFRFTIGSADNDVLKFWEPNAPLFEERLEALKLAFNAGYQTSISCEPMLDDNIEAVVEAVSPFVTDAIWIGKANHLKANLSVNGEKDAETIRRADELLSMQSDENIRWLYESLKDNPIIKWKESIKKVIGLEMPAIAGLDV